MNRFQFLGGILATLVVIISLHLYFYEMPHVYKTAGGECVAIAEHNKLQDCLGDLPEQYETQTVPNGTTIEEIWND